MRRSPILLLVVAMCVLALHVTFISPRAVHAATIVVDVDTDNSSVLALDQPGDGPCSLREAINNANNDSTASDDCTTGAGADIITFSGGFTIPFADAISVNTEILIDGQANTVIFDGNNAVGMFVLNAVDSNLSLDNLTLQNSGNSAVLMLDDNAEFACNLTRFFSNRATNGGAINGVGIVNIAQCLFDANEAENDGGAIAMGGTLTLVITNSYFQNNVAGIDDGGGSGVLEGSGGALSTGTSVQSFITATAFVNNTAHDDNNTDGGGAIYNNSDVFDLGVLGMNIVASLFSGNTVSESTDPNFPASAAPRGGAIYNQGTMRLLYSHFGTAPVIAGWPPVLGVTLPASTPNSVTGANGRGGAIYTSNEFFMIGTSLVGNTSAANGGALVLETGDDDVIIANSTFSGNTATGNGGAIYSIGNDDEHQLYNLTIASNTAASGGGIFNTGDGESPLVSEFDDIYIVNTILASNTGGNCAGTAIGLGELGNGNSSPSGNNVVFGGACDIRQQDDLGGGLSSPATPITTDPALGSLTIEFSLATAVTFYHPLNSGSSALGSGDQGVCDAFPVLTFDQRAIPGIRPSGDINCDIGAYESDAIGMPTDTPTATPTDTETPSQTPSQTLTPSETPSPSETATPSETPTASDTPSPSSTPTASDTPSQTSTPSETQTPSETPTASDTPSPSSTPTASDTPSQTSTPSETQTPSQTPTASDTPTPSETPTASDTPSQTSTPSETQTPSQTLTPSDTPSPSQTLTPSETLTPTSTNTPGGPTNSPTATNTVGGPTDTPTPTNTPGGPTDTATPTNTPDSGQPTPTTGSVPPVIDILDPIISKNVDRPFAVPGDTVTWTITVTNPGTVAATNVAVVDVVPNEAVLQSATATAGTIIVEGQVVTWTIPVLNPGESVTITIVTRVRDDLNLPFIITNRASVTNAEDPIPRQDEATVTSASVLPETGEPTPIALRLQSLVLIGIAGVLVLMGIMRWRRGRAG